MKFPKQNLGLFIKLLIKQIFIALAITLLNSTSIINATIPEYNGLYTIFTKKTDASPATDTIGIGQSLRYSNWLENVYTYAPVDNAAKKVIEILWFKRLINREKKFVEDDSFVPSIKQPASTSLKAKDFGKLIKYIRDFTKKDKDGKEKSTEQLNKERDAIKLTNKGKTDKKKLTEFVKALEELKCNTDKFIPEMAECILWAFFDRKENWGEKEFKECLDEIDVNYWLKLQDKKIQESSYTIDETTDKTVIEKLAKKLIKNPKDTDNLVHYDALTRYMIKSAKTKVVPNKVFQTNLNYKDPKTGNQTKEPFATCFESAILDVISILLYDRDNIKYDPNILPKQIKNGKTFQKLIDSVFKTLPKDKKYPKNKVFILSENINKKDQMQAWIDLVTNLDILNYKNNVDDISYDLISSIENFIKVLNKFLNLGFVITDGVNTLEIAFDKKEKITVEKNKLESWNSLFNKISEKLSTVNRQVKFSIQEMPIVEKEATKSMSFGTIDINIGETELRIIIEQGHAHVDCTERDKSQLAAKDLQNVKNILIYQLTHDIDNNKNLIPLFIFLPYIDVIYVSPTNKIKANHKKEVTELLYYSFELKDPNTKLDLLNKIFESKIPVIQQIYANESIRMLISKLIDILSKDEDFVYSLVSFLIACDDKDKESCWQNEIEAKINDNIYFIENAMAQKDKTELLDIFRNITIETKVINKFLKKILEIILQDPNIKDKDGMTPFLIACGCGGNVEIAKMLLANPKTDVNAKDANGNTAISLAASCNCGYTEIAKILIQSPRINLASKQEKLYSAAMGPDKAEIVEILLKNPKINVNAKNQSDGDTALNAAARNGEEEVVEMLVKDPRTDVSIKDTNGDTAIIIAAYSNKPKIVQILLDSKKIDSKNKDEALNKYTLTPEIIKIFIDDPEVDLISMQKLLYKSSLFKDAEIVKMLLDYPKIDINYIDKDLDKDNTSSPKEVAKTMKYDEIVNLFEEYEKKQKVKPVFK